MSNKANQTHSIAYGLMIMAVLILVAITPAAVLAGEGGVSYSGDDAYDPAASRYDAAITYSGDDDYDPAAASIATSPAPPINPSAFAARSSFGGDDAYDPAAGGVAHLPLFVSSSEGTFSADGSFGGDDAYDPAAGGAAHLPVFEVFSQVASSDTFGGDDAYDPAAGALFAEGCGLTAEQIASRTAPSAASAMSGDADYDPAAGGTPELALLSGADVASLLAACVNTSISN
jgi:hypothetical protein